MIYNYEDNFMISSIDNETLENIESEKYNFVLNKLNIDDNFYLEKLTKNLVYMELAKTQLESEGMKAKYNIYKAEYEHFLKLATSKSGVFNLKVVRG